MVLSLGVALWLHADSAAAPSREEWRFVFTMAGTEWDVRRGTAMLERSNSSLAGRLVDTAGVEYTLTLTVAANRAVGRLVILASDDGPFDLKGTYIRRTVALRPCTWTVIQLSDGIQSLGLLRTEDICRP